MIKKYFEERRNKQEVVVSVNAFMNECLVLIQLDCPFQCSLSVGFYFGSLYLTAEHIVQFSNIETCIWRVYVNVETGVNILMAYLKNVEHLRKVTLKIALCLTGGTKQKFFKPIVMFSCLTRRNIKI